MPPAAIPYDDGDDDDNDNNDNDNDDKDKDRNDNDDKDNNGKDKDERGHLQQSFPLALFPLSTSEPLRQPHRVSEIIIMSRVRMRRMVMRMIMWRIKIIVMRMIMMRYGLYEYQEVNKK